MKLELYSALNGGKICTNLNENPKLTPVLLKRSKTHYLLKNPTENWTLLHHYQENLSLQNIFPRLSNKQIPNSIDAKNPNSKFMPSPRL